MTSYSFTADDKPLRRMRCTECDRTTSVKRRMRTNPHNYHVDYRALCEPCSRKLGYGEADMLPRQSLRDL